MEKNGNIMAKVLLLWVAIMLAGCSAVPVKPGLDDAVFHQPAPAVQKAGIDALVVMGFDITKSEPLYLEGYRPRRWGFFVGSGGETVGIWLETLGPSRTGVRVATARTSFGYAGQKVWEGEILAEMEKVLGKRE